MRTCPRAIWITDTKLLGGFIGMDALLPLIFQNVQAGGYYQQQVTGGRVNGSTAHDRVAAVGLEISVTFPKLMLFVSCRYLYEFMAEDRAQGQTFVLNLTKRF